MPTPFHASDKKNRHIALSAVAALIALGFSTGQAQVYLNTGGGNWDTDADWSGGAEPIATDTVFVHGGLTTNISLAGEVANDLTIGSNDAGGPGAGTGRLNVTGGSLAVGNNLRLGQGAATEIGTLSQTGGTVAVSTDLQFGATGGTVQLYDLNGGTLDVTGNITHVGGSTRGHLYVDDPGALTVGGNILIQSFRVGDSQAGSHTVNVGQTLTNTGTLLVGRAAVGGLTINSTGNVAANMTVSDNAASAGSTLLISSGADLQVNGGTDIGDGAGTDGTVTVDGALDQNARLYIGGDATTDAGSSGTLILNATGTIDVNGGNTEVGRGGSGTLTVDGGTFNQNTSNLVVAQTGGSATGTITLNSGTINVVAGDLNMNGGTNRGFVDINGGTLNIFDDFVIASNNNGVTDTSQVTQTGGVVNVGLDANNARSLDIGNVGEGTYTISGGQINVAGAGTAQADIFVGNGATGVGTFNISDTADVNLEYRLIVGQLGTGTMNMDGGTVDARRYIIGQNSGAVGNAVVSGGTATFTEFLDVGQNAGSTGTLSIQSGGTVNANTSTDTIDIGQNADGAALVDGALTGRQMFVARNAGSTGLLQGDGTITLSVAGGLLIGDNGTLEPGTTDTGLARGTSEIGTLELLGAGGNATFASGATANMQINNALGVVTGVDLSDPAAVAAAIDFGLDPTTEHDALHVAGNLVFDSGSTVNVIDLADGSYTSGSYFDLFDGTITDSGATLVLPSIPGLSWNTSLFASEGIIYLVPEPSSAVLLLLAGLSLVLRRKKRC